MSSGTDITALYREFTDALTEVLAENAVGAERRGWLARARAAVKKHPEYSDAGYFLVVEAAFQKLVSMALVGPCVGKRRLHGASLADFSRQSLVANFQYPNFIGGDSFCAN